MDFDGLSNSFNRGGWKKLVNAVKRNQLKPGKDYTIRETPVGVSLDIRGGRGSATPDNSHPYKGYDASTGASPIINIQYGSHNGIVPEIDSSPMAVSREDNVLELAESDSIVYVELALDSGHHITDGTIQASSSALPTSDDTTAYQLLFAVDVSVVSGVASVAIAQNVGGSQAYQYCGGSHLFGLV